MNMKYRKDVDGLRAIAVLSVLIFHIEPRYLSGGFIGVDIFFVISGFLITFIIKNEIESTGKFAFKDFYIRRTRRLLPALFATLFITTVLVILLFSPSLLRSYGGSLSSSLLSVSNIFFWFESDYFDVSSRLKPLLHTWSLSVEEQFYLFWPLMLLIMLKIRNKKYLLGIIFFIAISSLFFNVIFQNGNMIFLSEYFSDIKSTIFFLLPFRIYEFMFGAILVWLINYNLKQKKIYDLLFIIGFFFLGYSIISFDEMMLFPSYYGLLPALGTSLIIYSAINSRFKILLSNKVLVGIGLISYSLYLVHWPIIVFWNYLDPEVSRYDQIFILCISFLIAYLSYIFIEQPFRKNKISFKSLKRKILFFIICLFFILGGLHMYKNEGWTWRVENRININDDYNSSLFHKVFYGGAGYKKYGLINQNTNSKKTIVLVGDSHGIHYAKGIENVLLKNNNINFYISSLNSFIYLPSFTRTTKGKEWDKISTSDFNKTIELINSTPNSKETIVIMSHFWVSQLKIAGIKNDKNMLIKDNIGFEELKEGIKEFKHLIKRRQLLIIGQVPTTNKENLYDIFTRPNIFLNNKSSKNYLVMELNQEYRKFNDSLLSYSLASGYFTFFNPMDLLCKNYFCKTTINNRLIYSDQTHLSIYGSEGIIDKFKTKLLKTIYGETNE